MRSFVSALVLVAGTAAIALPAAAQQQSGQQQPGQQQMQERMQDRMGQGGMQGQMPMGQGQGMMGQGQGMMGQGMMGQGQGMMGQGQGMMGRGMMGGGMMGGGMMGGMGPGRFVEGRLAFLEAELGIRQEQEPVWQDFTEAMRANAGSMQDMHRRMWSGEGMPESLPERLQLHEEAMSARLAAMRSMREALVPLYEALDQEQKQTLDDLMGMGMM